jgi:hypothetical protein
MAKTMTVAIFFFDVGGWLGATVVVVVSLIGRIRQTFEDPPLRVRP